MLQRRSSGLRAGASLPGNTIPQSQQVGCKGDRLGIIALTPAQRFPSHTAEREQALAEKLQARNGHAGFGQRDRGGMSAVQRRGKPLGEEQRCERGGRDEEEDRPQGERVDN
eukprot:3921422-Rhodomonas_salina.4